MEKDYQQVAKKVNTNLVDLHEALPQTLASFAQFGEVALEADQLNKKTKLLIALAIAVIKKSAECISFHLKHLIEEKVTREELTEVIAVIAYMDGGPGLIAGSDLLTAYDQLIDNAQK